MLIQKTKDYDQFKMVHGNREIDEHHYTDLTIQIAKKNLLYANPIIVNKDFEVIDGQHRLKVARDNNLDIYYLIVDNAGLQDIMELNAHTKNWTLDDYIKSYIKVGNKNYEILKEFSEHYLMSATIAAEILGGRAAQEPGVKGFKPGSTHLNYQLRAGKFEVKWLEDATKIMDHVIAFEPFYKRARSDRYFIRAIRQLYLDDKEKVIKTVEQRLLRTGKELERRYNAKDWMRELEEVHNFHVPEENRIRLY